MSMPPQAHLLEGGARLHLHHGPIDLIIGAEGPARNTCFERAVVRFQTVLSGLVTELDDLRNLLSDIAFSDPIARRMAAAVSPYNVFVTPMAAVAGAVADEILAAMLTGDGPAPHKAYVNNGGDIAFHIACGQSMQSLSPAGKMTLDHSGSARGLATSGWQGRSQSRGIADAVTVAATTAAEADVAATLIANAVDLVHHAGIKRTPAKSLNPDSDLGARLVTTHVPTLSAVDIDQALQNGAEFAQEALRKGLISQAALTLQGRSLYVTPDLSPIERTLENA